MTRTLQDLARFREEPQEAVEAARRCITLPEHLDWLLAVDPSVTNAGWVLLNRTEEGQTILTAGTIRPEKVTTRGAQQTFDRAMMVGADMNALVRAASSGGDRGLVVFESPPSQRMMRTESTWLGGLTVRQAASRAGVPCEMVHRQTVYGQVYGHANAKKAQAHAWLMTAYEGYYFERVTNEHERDAMMMAAYICERSEG